MLLIIAGAAVIAGAGGIYRRSLSWVPAADARVRAAQKQQSEALLQAAADQARTHPGDPQAQLQYARALADRDSYVKALIPAELAVKAAPRSPDAHLLLAMIYATLGYSADALDHYREVLRLDPNAMEAYQRMGQLLLATKDVVSAERVFRRAHARAPDLAGPRLSLAQCLFQESKSAACLDMLAPDLASPAPPVAALYLGGKAKQALGQTRQAAELLQRATLAQPDFAEAFHALGSLLANQGRYAEGISALERTVTLAPGNPTFQYALGNALRSDRSRPDALPAARQAFERSLELDPTFPFAHYYYGQTLEEMGETDAAIREYRRTLELSPNFHSARYRLGAVYKALGRRGEGDRYLGMFAQVIQHDIAVVHGGRRNNSFLDTAAEHDNRGLAFLREGDRGRARDAFRMALQRDPRDGLARRQLRAMGDLPQ